MAIAEIDLRRDLPKVREQWDALMAGRRECRYAAPCAIGAMVPVNTRQKLDNLLATVGELLKMGHLDAPREQYGDLSALQIAFDCQSQDFDSVLAELEAKYLTSGDK